MVKRLQRAHQSTAFSKGGQGAVAALTVTVATVRVHVQLSRSRRKRLVRGRGLVY